MARLGRRQPFKPLANTLWPGFRSAGNAYTLTAATASFELTGVAAVLTAQRKLTAAASVFTLTGNAAGLIYTPISTRDDHPVFRFDDRPLGISQHWRITQRAWVRSFEEPDLYGALVARWMSTQRTATAVWNEPQIFPPARARCRYVTHTHVRQSIDRFGTSKARRGLPPRQVLTFVLNHLG